MPKKQPILEKEAASENDRHFVTSLARGFEILKAFSAGERWLGNTELVERTKLPKSTVARLTRTLEKLDYLRYDSRLQKYRLSTALLSFGYALLRDLDIPRLASPLMRELASDESVNVGLAIADGPDMVYLDTALGGGNNVYGLATGNILPMEETAIGQSYFAVQPIDRQKELLAEMKAKRPATFKQGKLLLDRARDEIDSLGFCITEWKSDMLAAAAPIIDNNGKCEFTINCGAPVYLLSRERLLHDVGPRLVHIVASVKRGLAVLNGNPNRILETSTASRNNLNSTY